MRVALAVAIVALSLGCSRSMTEPLPLGPEGVSMDAGAWSVSLGTTHNTPFTVSGGGWGLHLPGPDEGDVCYLTTPISRSLPYGATIRASFDIIGDPAATYITYGGDTPPASITLMMRHPLDAVRTNETGRLWASHTRLPAAGGHGELIATLTPSQWGTVHAGELSDKDFRDWITHVAEIGVSFGGASFAGHCISVGPVSQDRNGLTFIMREFSIT